MCSVRKHVLKNFAKFTEKHQVMACNRTAPGEKCPNTEFFWSIFSGIWTEYGDLRSPNTGKYGAEKLRIWTIFTQ